MYISLAVNILPLSKSKIPLEIVNEWDFLSSYYMESGDNCLCGHDIKEICLIRNKHTNQIVKVGNCCVRYFTEKITELPKRTFDEIGLLRDKDTKINYWDILDRLSEITKSAIRLFVEMRKRVAKNSRIITIKEFNTYTHNEMREIYRNVAQLKKYDLIQKLVPVKVNTDGLGDIKTFVIPTARHSYMINPHLIIPTNKPYAYALWEALKKNLGEPLLDPERPLFLPKDIYARVKNNSREVCLCN